MAVNQAAPLQRKPGRPKKDTERKVTRRELKDKELLILLRKIKPHIAESVMTAARIMKKENATDVNKLKAAALLLEQYRKLALDVYDVDAEDMEEDIPEQTGNVFSLRMINTGEDEE